jgi:DNA invertase Pin-like site-specific DNA recombinase
MPSKKPYLVAYYRVSTVEQGSSRLGLEAQREAVREYAGRMGLSVFSELEEVVSTRKERPVFEEALQMCEQLGHTLAVARLDRLSRDLHTITSLQKSGVDFVAVDMPGASKFMVQILGAVAENERDMISERTKAALARAKANGTRLGAPDPVANAAAAIYARSLAAQEFRAGIRDELRDMRASGATFQQIADHLNRKDWPTASGKGTWCPTKVRNALKDPVGLNLAPASEGVPD